MDRLSPHSEPVHDGIEVVDQKVHELFLGQTKRPHPGMKLWGFDPISGQVYQVHISSKKVVTLNIGTSVVQDTGTHQATLHNDHRYLWAINPKNAIRKFRKSFGIPEDGDISKMML